MRPPVLVNAHPPLFPTCQVSAPWAFERAVTVINFYIRYTCTGHVLCTHVRTCTVMYMFMKHWKYDEYMRPDKPICAERHPLNVQDRHCICLLYRNSTNEKLKSSTVQQIHALCDCITSKMCCMSCPFNVWLLSQDGLPGKYVHEHVHVAAPTCHLNMSS